MRRRAVPAGVLLLLAAGARADDAPPPQQHTVGIAHSCDGYQPKDLSVGYDGTTTLRFNVMVSGRVSDIEIAKSSGNTELDNAAIDCASHWKYKPATVDGRPVQKPWEAAVVWRILPLGTIVPKPAPSPAPAR